MDNKFKHSMFTTVRSVVLMFVSLVYIVPFYIATVNAFKNEKDIIETPLSIPFSRLTLENLQRNLNSPNFNALQAYSFTLAIVSVTLLFVLVIASMFSYMLSRNRSGIYKTAYLMLLGGMMIPIQVIMLPIIQILKTFNLMLSAPGLILVYIAWYMPFSTFVLTGYISTISPQLDESARMDGAGPLLIFFRIILPLMRPALVSVAIFITVWTWNDFITPLVVLGSSTHYTVTTGIYRAIGQYTQKWDDVFAILFYAIMPLAVCYIWLQKYFVSGLTAGSIKS